MSQQADFLWYLQLELDFKTENKNYKPQQH